MMFERHLNRGSPLNEIIKAQDRSMTLDEVATGYTPQIKEMMSGPAAPAIRNEVKKYAEAISSSEGVELQKHLQELGESLKAYRAFFGGMWEDKDERPALMLALVKYEKSLQ